MTKAQSILERMGIAVANQITLTVQGVPFTFNRNDEAYAELQTMVGKGESAVGLMPLFPLSVKNLSPNLK